MRTRTQPLLVVAALLGAVATPAPGQQTAVDSRWLAYLGCWEPIESAKSRVCVVPATGASAVDLVTIVKGQVTAREHIAATGERLETARADCTGWQSGAWSARGQRIYLRSEDACAGGNTRGGTGVIAMAGDGQWLYIQGMTLGGQTGISVQRYREVTSDSLLPDDVMDAVRPDVSSRIRARAAAAVPLSINDVVEASRLLDAAVLEAWLVERGEPFTLDAQRLIELADARVPTRVIDLMVALSYPNRFAINTTTRQGERRTAPVGLSRGGAGARGIAAMDPLCSTLYRPYLYASYDCMGFARGYGYGYGYGWYPGGYPVTIVYVGSGGSARPHGRVVNGQGYREGAGTGSSAIPRLPEPTRATPSGPTSGSPGSSSTSSSGEQRTAKPRPHW